MRLLQPNQTKQTIGGPRVDYCRAGCGRVACYGWHHVWYCREHVPAEFWLGRRSAAAEPQMTDQAADLSEKPRLPTTAGRQGQLL